MNPNMANETLAKITGLILRSVPGLWLRGRRYRGLELHHRQDQEGPQVSGDRHHVLVNLQCYYKCPNFRLDQNSDLSTEIVLI